MDVLAERTGGHTKYINQRDEHYLAVASLQDENYNKQFTDALDHFVVEHQWKYMRFTNLIYQCIFRENATGIPQGAEACGQENILGTMYSGRRC